MNGHGNDDIVFVVVGLEGTGAVLGGDLDGQAVFSEAGEQFDEPPRDEGDVIDRALALRGDGFRGRARRLVAGGDGQA